MRKLIETSQENFIECDNIKCDFVIKNDKKSEGYDDKDWIGIPCPKCGENLLTEKDYLDHIKLIKAVDFINKWFSWIIWFSKSKKESIISVKVHDGYKIKEEKK